MSHELVYIFTPNYDKYLILYIHIFFFQFDLYLGYSINLSFNFTTKLLTTLYIVINLYNPNSKKC